MLNKTGFLLLSAWPCNMQVFVEGQKEVSDAVQHHLNLVKEKSSEQTRLEQLVHTSSLTDK